MSPRRKDRVLNTRIPEDLDREIREHAERLDVSVSQFVREVLERTVNLVGNLSGNAERLVNDIVEDVGEFRTLGDPDRASRNARAREIGKAVIGWQKITVNRLTRCALSARELCPGEDAHLGVRTDGRPSVLISPDSLDQLLSPPPLTWVPIRLQQAAQCSVSGRTISAGDEAYFTPETQPPQFLCEEEYRALNEGDPQ
jgi:hypothetical protein